MTEEVAAAILALAETIERARLDDELGESYPGAGDVSARDKVQAGT